MEELMLDQFMKLSVQIGEFKGEIKSEINSLRNEMHDGFKAQGQRIDNLEKEVKDMRVDINVQGERIDNLEKEMHDGFNTQIKRIDNLEKEMHDGFNTQSKETLEIRHIIEENTKDTASIFHDIFDSLEKKQNKIVNLNS